MLGAATVIVLGVVAVSYLQHRFDVADLKNAVKAVQTSRPLGPQGPTLVEELSQRYGVQPQSISWIPQIESKVQGTVQVQAVVPGREELLVWKVDLVRYRVMPASSGASELGQAPPSAQGQEINSQ